MRVLVRGKASHFGFSLIIALAAISTTINEAKSKTSGECLSTWDEPIVKITYVKAKPKLNRRKSGTQIEKIAKKSGYAKPKGHGNLLGLTHSSIGPSIALSTKYIEAGDGQFCLKLRRVDFIFGIRKSEIFVDRQYSKSSCAFKVIFAHEMEHVKINEKVLDDFSNKISKEFRKRAFAVKPFYTRDPKKAAQSIIKRLTSEMKPILNRFSKKREIANDVIDTNEAYADTQAKCNDW
jgi:hypothetical protein